MTHHRDDTKATSHKQKTKQRAAFWSIIASVIITLGKGITGLMTGSLALISDAAHSLLDIAATSITYWAIKAADKPADDEHHYGHGKVESLAALFETAFLFILSGVVAYEGIRRLFAGETDFTPSWIAAGVLVASIIIDAWRWWALKKVAYETNSEALEADALHFSSDLINSILVLAAFALAAQGYPQADAFVAIGVALFIAIAGYRLASRNLSNLIDAAPRGMAQIIENKVQSVPGVVGVDKIRVRTSGGRLMGDILIRVSRTLPLENVLNIKQIVNNEIRELAPEGHFTITADPITLDDETLLERVILIGLRLKVPVHHITIQTINPSNLDSGRLSISADLEINRLATLLQAHAIATRFEDAIRAEFGPDTEVETHLEPLEETELSGSAANPDDTSRITALLSEHTKINAVLQNIHDVRVRQTMTGLVVIYHCYAPADLSVERVHHAIDALERTIRVQMPEVTRIVGHAEPLTS
jgi:cation diffusion facilitator family transporter